MFGEKWIMAVSKNVRNRQIDIMNFIHRLNILWDLSLIYLLIFALLNINSISNTIFSSWRYFQDLILLNAAKLIVRVLLNSMILAQKYTEENMQSQKEFKKKILYVI